MTWWVKKEEKKDTRDPVENVEVKDTPTFAKPKT